MYIGIDPGLNGGLTVIDENENIIKSIVMPTIKIKGKTQYDIHKIIMWFSELVDPYDLNAALEESHVRPVQGKRAAYMTGFGSGMFQSMLESMSVSYMIIRPQEWMKELQLSSKDKKESIIFCQRKWPKENWRATDKCKNAHDGKTDSACIALYCKRRIK